MEKAQIGAVCEQVNTTRPKHLTVAPVVSLGSTAHLKMG